MTIMSIAIFIGYAALHVVSIVQTDRCLWQFTDRKGIYRIVRPVWIILYILMALIPVAGTFLPSGDLKYTLTRIGNITLGFDLYFCGFLVFFTLIAGLVRWIKRKRYDSVPPKARWILNVAVFLGLLLPAYGLIHAQHPVVTYWSTDISADAAEARDLRVVLIADLHLGVNSRPQLIRDMVDLVNAQEPDVILVAGDIFTSSYEGLKDPDTYLQILQEMKAKQGIYAVYGNHDVEEDLFGGFEVTPVQTVFRPDEMEDFIRACGMTILEDETVSIVDGTILLVGRTDAMKAGDGTNQRLSAEQLLSGRTEEEVVFVLEHEPYDYKALDAAGADMVFSGHTHKGQIFPANFFVGFFNDNAYGCRIVEDLVTYVTQGVGYYGPPMRIMTDSEVMVIDIRY